MESLLLVFTLFSMSVVKHNAKPSVRGMLRMLGRLSEHATLVEHCGDVCLRLWIASLVAFSFARLRPWSTTLLPIFPISSLIVPTILITFRANVDPDFHLANSNALDTYHFGPRFILFRLITLECTASQSHAYVNTLHFYSSKIILNSFDYMHMLDFSGVEQSLPNRLLLADPIN